MVDDPAASIRLLDKLCAPAKLNGQRKRAVNPVSPADVKLFAAAMRGEHFIHGFRNGNLATHLGIDVSEDKKEAQTPNVTDWSSVTVASGSSSHCQNTRVSTLSRNATRM